MGQIPANLQQLGGQMRNFAQPYITEAGRQVTAGTDDGNLPAEQRAQRVQPFPIQDYGYKSPTVGPPPGWWKQNQALPNQETPVEPEPQAPRRQAPTPGATTTFKRASYSGF